MKSLSVSLIVVVIVAVIGIGWLITEIDLMTGNAGLARNDAVTAYQRMIASLAQTLDTLPERQSFLAQWRQQGELRLTLVEAAAFPVPAELSTNFEAGQTLVLESEGTVSVHAYLPRAEEVLSLVLPTELVRDAALRPSLLLTLLFYVGVVAVVLLWLYPLVTRLQVLRNTAQAFGRGELAARVAPGGFSHIAVIENEFNHMAERIQALIADNKLLGQAVSHNLKTPLARLRFGFEALSEARDEGTRDKYAQRIGKDLADMESLVETLLQYAKLEESTVQLQWQRTELKAFVAQLLADLGDTSVGIQFDAGGTEVHVETDPNYLAILLHNLLGNALKHARARINVSVHATGDAASIVVEDDGPGILPSERALVLEPFRRGSNSAGLPGHGMGLAIVARIARWLDATVQVADSTALGGAAVSLHLSRR